MDTMLNSSRAPSRANEGPGTFNLFPGTASRTSKAQEILGLSRLQIQNANDESLHPQSEPLVGTSPIHPKGYTRGLFSRGRNKATTVFVQEIRSQTPNKQATFLDQDPNPTSLSRDPSLSRAPSNSTLRSFYDAAKAPLRVSQQTSHSSSQEFLQRTPQPLPPGICNNNMDSEGYRRFFSAGRQNNRSGPTTDRSEFGSDSGPTSKTSSEDNVKSGLTPKSQTSNFSVSKPEPLDSNRPTTASSRVISGANSPLPNPLYAKLNVRRPKKGNKNWFDDVDGLSSDEEDRNDQYTEVQVATDENQISNDNRETFLEPTSTYGTTSPASQMVTSVNPTLVELSAGPKSPVAENKGQGRLVERPPMSNRHHSDSESRGPAVHAEASIQRIPHGKGDLGDYEVDNNMNTLQPVTSLEGPSPIRDSADADVDDKSIKIETVRVVTAIEQNAVRQLPPIKIRRHRNTPSISESLLRRTLEVNEDDIDMVDEDVVEAKSADEDEIMSSFPATPTDVVMPRKTSSRSSVSQSDDRSVGNMRLMKVTRQEEQLIAAMRSKKASMQRAADEAAILKTTAPIQQYPAEKVFVATSRPRTYDIFPHSRTSIESRNVDQKGLTGLGLYQEQNRLDSSQLVKAYLNALPDRNSTEEIPPPPILSRKIGRSQTVGVSSERVKMAADPDVRPMSASNARPSTALSTRSHVYRTRENNIIVLENLYSGFTSQALPSQLYIESPFASWERKDSATVR